MGYQDMEESRIYQRAERLADQVWNNVIRWDSFAKDTVGKQLCRATDSIGANIAESAGRYSPNDVIRFLHYARGSLRETRFWLKRANQRQLITTESFNQLISELNKMGAELNSYINFQRTRTIKEPNVEYQTNTPNEQTD